MTVAAEILTELHRRGVTLTGEGDTLCLKPRRALDDTLLARIREVKPAILEAFRNGLSACGSETVRVAMTLATEGGFTRQNAAKSTGYGGSVGKREAGCNERLLPRSQEEPGKPCGRCFSGFSTRQVCRRLAEGKNCTRIPHQSAHGRPNLHGDASCATRIVRAHRIFDLVPQSEPKEKALLLV
jgi:hypothetical protein